MRHALAMIALLLAASPAAAEDYPFSGDLAIAGNPDGADALDPRRCAMSFLRQDAKGEFTAYHIDLDQFIATGQASYVIFQKGRCEYDAKTRIERCRMIFDTDRSMQNRVFIDVLDSVGDPYVRTMAFDDEKQALDYAATGAKGDGYRVSFFRCNGDRAKLDAALSKQASPLPREIRDRLTAPDEAMLQRKEVIDLAKALGLEK